MPIHHDLRNQSDAQRTAQPTVADRAGVPTDLNGKTDAIRADPHRPRPGGPAPLPFRLPPALSPADGDRPIATNE